MRKILAVFLREYLDRVKRKSFIIGLILGPLLMGAVIVLPVLLSEVETQSSEDVMILDESGRHKAAVESAIQSELPNGSPQYRFLDEGLAGAEAARLADQELLDDLIRNEDLDWYLRIPADIDQALTIEFHGRIVSNARLFQTLETQMDQVLRRARITALNLDEDVFEHLNVRTRLLTFSPTQGGGAGAGFESVTLRTFILVMILYMTILGFGVMIQRSILEDKTQKVTEVVLSSMRAEQFFTGKILGIGAVGLTQYLAWALMVLVAAPIGMTANLNFDVLDAIQPSVFAFFILFYVLGFFLYAGLSAIAGAIVTTDQEAQQALVPVLMLILVPVLSMTFIMQNPDSTASIVLSMIPFFSPLIMFMRVNLATPPVWQLLLSIGILLGTTALVFWMAGRIFKVGILMTGKKASLQEAMRWLRQA